MNEGWTKIRQRLGRSQAAVDELLDPSPQRVRAILDERARKLAGARAERAVSTNTLEILGFTLGCERYAVESKYIREVVRLADFTPVPGAPEFLLGIINLRGQILALADLGRFLGLPLRSLNDLTCVVVLGAERPELGIVVDGAHELQSIAVAATLDPPESVAGIGHEYLLGVTKDALVILDGARLLADPRLFVDMPERSET